MPSQVAQAAGATSCRRSTITTALNAFEVKNASVLAFDVQILNVTLKDRSKQSFVDLGEAKNAVWELKKQNKTSCRGYGFVIDAGKSLVAIPATWKLPIPFDGVDYRIDLHSQFRADLTTALGRRVLCGIIKESLKKRFKDQQCVELGPLWRDYDSFAQVPTANSLW